MIIGIFVASIGLVFVMIHCVVTKYKYFQLKPLQSDSSQDPSGAWSCIKQHKVVSTALFVMFFLLWGLPVGAERAYGKFLFAFSTDSELSFGPKTATDLVMVFWITFTAGRALASFMSLWLEPFRLLVLELIVSLASTTTLSICAHNQEIALWVCTAFFAASLSPICPGSLAWSNIYIPMTPVLTSIAFIATAAGSIAFSWISGYLFEYHGPRSLMFFMLAYSLSAMSLVFCIYSLNRSRPIIKRDRVEESCEMCEKA